MGELIQQGGQIRNLAREILVSESQQRTGQKYWTGRLYDAIQSRPVIREENVIGISIGVDERSAPYAEWVEIGHSTGFNADWWEGYHFMEQAFAQLGPEIDSKIASTLKVTMKKYDVRKTGFAHRGTGRFVKGSAGFNIQ